MSARLFDLTRGRGPRRAAWVATLAGLLASAGALAQTAAPRAPLPGATAAPVAPAPPVAATLERQEIRAQLIPRRYTTIASEIGAKVASIPVPDGGSFRAGQVLVTFDCSLQRAQLDKALAELTSAEQTLKANLRLEQLNSVGQLELDLSKSAVAKAQADANASQAVVAKCEVPAPFAGRVAEQRVREQQFVQPGQPLLDILDDSVLELEFLAPSSWLRWLRIGGSFEVQIDETRKTYPARFIRLGARVDPVSQSVKVVGTIYGRFPELMAGMSGRVRVTPPAGQ